MKEAKVVPIAIGIPTTQPPAVEANAFFLIRAFIIDTY